MSIEKLFSFLDEAELANDKSGAPADEDLRMAAAVALWAVGTADGLIEESEGEKICEVLARKFDISREEAARYRSISHVLKEGAELEACLDLIKSRFSDEQKQRVLDMATEVARADSDFSSAERTMCDFLRQRLGLEV